MNQISQTTPSKGPLRSIEKDRGRFTRIIVLLVAIGIAIFGATRIATLVQGPEISIEYPTDGTRIHDQTLKVLGRAQNISSLYMNGHPVYTDSYGYFDETLLVPPGYSILEVTAKDRFGRTVTKQIRVIYK
ncbi:MAG: hypothetical protein V4674_04045 [Patescibacteria group bacterium]